MPSSATVGPMAEEELPQGELLSSEEACRALHEV